MSHIPATVGAVWKNEAARIVAGLMRIVRDVGLAEELAQDAMVAALEQWPAGGVPDNPGAWLMTVAKRRAVDHLRRADRLGRTQQALARDLARAPEPGEPAGDDVLRLMFVSCHPVLPTEARVALTLRVIGGLTAAEIARAFLVTEPVINQRIAAAKRTLAEAGVPFELPAGAELAERLSSVLEVVYLIFNEGYAATSGDDLMRPALCLEALRLGRLLADLAPDEAEVHGLVALMEIQQSRSAARTGPSGEPVPLPEQNRGRWDRLLIRRGFTALLRARELGGPAGPYVLQAAIAVCHAQAATAEDTDWVQIATLYEALARLMPTPIVQLNRAVAVGMANGPQAGLDLVDTLRADPALRDYHLLPGVRGDLLLRLGRRDEARQEFDRAAAMAGNAAEREFLRRRMAALETGDESVQLGAAIERFLAGDGRSAATVRAYRHTLERLVRAAGPGTPVTALTAATVARLFATTWPDTAPRTWNRHRSAIRSFAGWAGRPDLTAGVDRRTEEPTARPAVTGVAALFDRADLPLRERTLWCLLSESAAPVGAVLALNVEDLDLDDRRAPSTGGRWVAWRSGTARLLPALIAGRTRGPLFLAGRRPGPARAGGHRCPDTGRRRLSYERAEYLCKRATGLSLGQLRSSGRTTREMPSRTPTSVPAG